jgi:hypothetical protein
VLVAQSDNGAHLKWVCPDGNWECSLGDYAELSWPNFDLDELAPLLTGRLERRGIRGVVTIGVRATDQGAVADFGVPEMSDELTRALEEAAAPLPVIVHHESRLHQSRRATAMIEQGNAW